MNSTLMLENLVSHSLQVAALAAAAAILPRVLRIRLPAFLLAYWQLVLLACLALPVLQTWQPVEATPALGAALLDATADTEPVPSQHVGAAGDSPAWQGWVLALLLAGAGLRLAWMCLGLRRLRRLCAKARRLEAAPGQAELFCCQFGIRPSFYLTSELGTPATFGLFRPRVILPLTFESMRSEQQRSLICHELIHLKRRDWLYVLAEEMVRCLFWFHPAIWWLISRIRLTREQEVDREVVRRTRQRKAYVELLLSAAESQLKGRNAPAPSFFRPDHLSERVASLIQEVSMSPRRLVLSVLAIVTLLAPAGRLALWAFPMKSPAGAQAPQPIQSRPLRVGGSVMAARLIEKVDPEFPEEALKARVQGVVFLSVTVNEAGEVWKVDVLRGHPLLTPAAVDAVRQWRYEPVLVNGVPVPVQATVTVHFQPPGSEDSSETGLVRHGGSDSRLRLSIDEDGTVWFGNRQLEDGDLDQFAEAAKKAVIAVHPKAPAEALQRLRERFGTSMVVIGPAKQSFSTLLVEPDWLSLQVRLSGSPRATVFRAFLDGKGNVQGLEYQSGPDEPEIQDLALAQLRAYLSRQKTYPQPAVPLQSTELFVALVQRP